MHVIILGDEGPGHAGVFPLQNEYSTEISDKGEIT
jgi:hypothetical protein